MAAFKFDKEICYEKPTSEALIDIEKALNMIGKIQKVSKEEGVIQGKTKYGLQTIKITAHVEADAGNSKILFHGKSDDAMGMGAQKGINNLINTINNLDNSQYVPSKTGGVKPGYVIVWILEFTVSLFLIFGLRTGTYPASMVTILLITWLGLLGYLILHRLKNSKK